MPTFSVSECEVISSEHSLDHPRDLPLLLVLEACASWCSAPSPRSHLQPETITSEVTASCRLPRAFATTCRDKVIDSLARLMQAGGQKCSKLARLGKPRLDNRNTAAGILSNTADSDDSSNDL